MQCSYKNVVLTVTFALQSDVACQPKGKVNQPEFLVGKSSAGMVI